MVSISLSLFAYPSLTPFLYPVIMARLVSFTLYAAASLASAYANPKSSVYFISPKVQSILSPVTNGLTSILRKVNLGWILTRQVFSLISFACAFFYVVSLVAGPVALTYEAILKGTCPIPCSSLTLSSLASAFSPSVARAFFHNIIVKSAGAGNQVAAIALLVALNFVSYFDSIAPIKSKAD